MRYYVFMAIACGALFIACKNKSASFTGNQDSAKMKAVITGVDERTSKKQALEKLIPFGLEEMKKIMPSGIDGIKQSNFNYSTQWGYAYASADYNKTKALGITLTIYDCAGDQGSDYYLNNFYDKLPQSRQDSTEYTKTVDMMGEKAIESYNSQVNYATLNYMTGDRILVMMQGKKMKPRELKAIAQKLKLKP